MEIKVARTVKEGKGLPGFAALAQKMHQTPSSVLEFECRKRELTWEYRLLEERYSQNKF